MTNTRMQIRAFRPSDEDGVVTLWRTVFPDAPAHNDPGQDIRAKLLVQPEAFLVAVSESLIVGSAMAGFDGHRGWVYYVAVHPDFRRRGIGTALMRAAEDALHQLGCRKLNLQIRAGNERVKAFYESLGYQVEERVSMGKRLGE